MQERIYIFRFFSIDINTIKHTNTYIMHFIFGKLATQSEIGKILKCI